MAKPTLIFLPGLLENADAFGGVVEEFSSSHHCIVADLTGADSIAGLAREVLSQAPAGPFLIAGHSMGGYVALELMRQAPERISRLALMNTNARPDTPESSENRRRLMALADKDFPSIARTLMPKLLLPTHLDVPRIPAIVEAMAEAIGPEAFKRQQRAIIGRIDSRPHLSSIGVQTLVVAARGDAIMPLEVLKELSDTIPGAMLAIVEDSGHLAPLEQPARILSLLREWAA